VLSFVSHNLFPAACSESLYEDEEFVQRQLAALVASKVFFYLGELNDALSYALGAGPLFDVSDDSDYAQTLLGEELPGAWHQLIIASTKSTVLTLPPLPCFFIQQKLWMNMLPSNQGPLGKKKRWTLAGGYCGKDAGQV